MQQRFRRWLDQILLTNPIQRRQALMRLLVLISWIVLVTPGILPLVVPPSGGAAASVPPAWIIAVLQIASLLLLVSPASALILLRRGRFRAAVLAATLGLLAAHSMATFLLGVTSGAVLVVSQIPIMDTQVAQGLLMTVRAARLLGTEVVLVGIRPEVAQSIVGLGLELRDVRTFRDLQSALS